MTKILNRNTIVTTLIITITTILITNSLEASVIQKAADFYSLKGTIASDTVVMKLSIYSGEGNEPNNNALQLAQNTSANENDSENNENVGDNNQNNDGKYYADASFYYYNSYNNYNNRKYNIENNNQNMFYGDGWHNFLTLIGKSGEFTGQFDFGTKTYKGNFLNLVKNKIEVFNFSLASQPTAHLEIFAIEYALENFAIKYFKIPTANTANDSAKNKYSTSVINSMIEQNIAEQNKKASDITLIASEYDYHGTYHYNGGFDCLYLDENIISIYNHHSYYAGGEEKSVQNIAYVYSIKTGKLLNNAASLFNNKNNATLLALYRTKTRNVLENSVAQSENNATNIDTSFTIIESRLSALQISDNFYVDESGIHFIVNILELVSASDDYQGSVIISFGFDELSPFVYKLSPLYYLFY